MSIEVKRRRWRLLGHVLRMSREHLSATKLTWTPMGTKRKVGRPKTTWRRAVEKKREIVGWKSWEEVKALAKDRDIGKGVQSDLDYPDLDYPDYSIIRTFFSGPVFS